MLKDIELYEALRRDDLVTVISGLFDSLLNELSPDDTPEMLLSNPSSIMVAAFFGSTKCFNFLFNRVNIHYADVSFNIFKKFFFLFHSSSSIFLFLIKFFFIFSHRVIFHFAAAGGNMMIFNSLMKFQRINEKYDMYGNTPLHYACKYARVPIVQMICSHSSNVLHSNINGLLASHFAAIAGCVQALQLLHENDDNLIHVDSKQWTPLHYALKYKHVDAVKYLLDIGAVVSTKFDIAATIIQHAVSYLSDCKDSIDIIQTIIHKLNTSDSLNHNRWNMLHFAAANGYADLIQNLRGAISEEIYLSVDRNDRTLAHIATINGNLNVLIALNNIHINLYDKLDKYGISF